MTKAGSLWLPAFLYTHFGHKMSKQTDFFIFSLREKGERKNLKFLCCIVGFDGLGLNNHARVASLPILALRCYRPCHIARTQSERNRHACHNSRYHRGYNLVNLLLSHNLSFLCLLQVDIIHRSIRPTGRSNSNAVCQCNGLSAFRRSASLEAYRPHHRVSSRIIVLPSLVEQPSFEGRVSISGIARTLVRQLVGVQGCRLHGALTRC